MAKIFGISDLPPTTMISSFNQNLLPEPTVRYIGRLNYTQEPDMVILKNQSKKIFNPKQNGVGRMMKHFSKRIIH